MIPLDSALRIVDDAVRGRRLATEVVNVREAAGRVLSADQTSKLDLPPFDKSAVDGYAVIADDERDEYRLIGTIAAGRTPDKALAPGTTIKVMTGAPVPEGTGKVIMVERATEREAIVRFEPSSNAENICRRAEDIAVGQMVIKAGAVLGSLEVSNLIGCGITEVEVSRRPVLSIISTGDEIVESITRLGPGKIMNTNGPLLKGLAEAHGLKVSCVSTVPDDRPALLNAVRQSLGQADIVVLSGGVSAGDFDFVPEVITECGLEIHFSKIAAKPGKPTVFASGEKGILFGLPGNPVAVYVMFHLFVLRAALRMSGGAYEPLSFTARLARDFTRRAAGRTEYFPCRILPDGRLDPVRYHGSAHLTALMEADGFLVIPKGIRAIAEGEDATLVMPQRPA